MDSLFPDLPDLDSECAAGRHSRCSTPNCTCGCGHGFDPRAHARATDPATSGAAAARAALRATSNAAQLLTGYRTPATHEEAADRAGLSHETGHKRTSDLKQRGFIQPTGRTRPGKSGSQMTVYAITTEGVRYLGVNNL
jgi:hypothetical protein